MSVPTYNTLAAIWELAAAALTLDEAAAELARRERENAYAQRWEPTAALTKAQARRLIGIARQRGAFGPEARP